MNCTGPEFQELSKELLSGGGTLRFQAQGGSMYPFIRGEEVVKVKAVPLSEIRHADIVLYHSPDGRTILHRVLKIRKDREKTRFFTKGDSLCEADGYIDGNSIIGKVIAIQKGRLTLDLEKYFWKYINILYALCLPSSRWSTSLVVRVLRSFTKAHSATEEHKLLIGLLRGEELSAGPDEAGLNGSVWERILNKAKEECVFYPAYRRLLESGQIGSIPGPIRRKLEASYHLYLAHSASRAHMTDQVLKSLGSIDTRMLLIKGPAVDPMVYDGFLRPRVDLDLVIGKKISDVEHGLASLGYLSKKGEGSRRATTRLKFRVFMNKEAELIPIHVHSHLINNTFLTSDGLVDIGMEDVWNQTEAYKDYHNITVLKPELNILYLCDHGLKHDFNKLIYLYEIERLIAYYGERLDWNKFIGLTRSLGMERTVYYGLYFTREIFKGNIPGEVIASIKPKSFSAAENIFIKNTLNGKRRRYSSFLVYIAARPGFLRKLNFIFRMAFPQERPAADNI